MSGSWPRALPSERTEVVVFCCFLSLPCEIEPQASVTRKGCHCQVATAARPHFFRHPACAPSSTLDLVFHRSACPFYAGIAGFSFWTGGNKTLELTRTCCSSSWVLGAVPGLPSTCAPLTLVRRSAGTPPALLSLPENPYLIDLFDVRYLVAPWAQCTYRVRCCRWVLLIKERGHSLRCRKGEQTNKSRK